MKTEMIAFVCKIMHLNMRENERLIAVRKGQLVSEKGRQKQQKIPSGFKAYLVITNYLLKIKAWDPLLFSGID